MPILPPNKIFSAFLPGIRFRLVAESTFFSYFARVIIKEKKQKNKNLLMLLMLIISMRMRETRDRDRSRSSKAIIFLLIFLYGMQNAKK